MLTFYIGAVIVIALIASIGILTGKSMKKSSQFDNSRKATSGLVAGALIGTLVGGSSTIGTAQLAYTYGFSAWWYTLGGGIGMLLLGAVFAKPFYNSGTTTLPDIFKREYGKKTALILAILSSIGTFLSFVAQIISGTALITTVTSLSFTWSIVIVMLLMIVYVLWGGTLALGYGGIAKTILVSLTVLVCGIVAIVLGGGIGGYTANELLPHEQYFNLVARGPIVDLGSGMSLLIGIITTQSYFSAIVTAKSLKASKSGAFITAIIVPIMGIAGVFVGMYMKLNYPGIVTKTALPVFIQDKMPPLIAGIMLATLLVTVTGTGAGLSFGMASMVYRNIYKSIRPNAKEENSKTVIRIILLGIILLGALLCYANLGDTILSWSFLSMGLRGAVAAIPLIFALALPGKVEAKWAIISMFCGAAFTLVGKLVLPASVDPLFLGVFVSGLAMVLGLIFGKKKADHI